MTLYGGKKMTKHGLTNNMDMKDKNKRVLLSLQSRGTAAETTDEILESVHAKQAICSKEAILLKNQLQNCRDELLNWRETEQSNKSVEDARIALDDLLQEMAGMRIHDDMMIDHHGLASNAKITESIRSMSGSFEVSNDASYQANYAEGYKEPMLEVQFAQARKLAAKQKTPIGEHELVIKRAG